MNSESSSFKASNIYFKSFSILLLFITFYGHVCLGQMLPLDRNTQKGVKKGTRTTTGVPGKNYWQNSADYKLDIHFDPKTLELTGEAEIVYINNSPDTLSMMLFKLYPNLYKTNAMRNTVVAGSDLGPGVKISAMTIDDSLIDSARRRVNGTNMYIRGLKIAPGKHTSIKISYTYRLNATSFNRTGQVEKGACFVAYCFPRVAVYDDIDGWNEYPYMGKEEFYNDYGSFNVSITVPGNYQVWATGDLKNTTEVYEPAFAARIAKAELQDSIIDIISSADIERGHITKDRKLNTWKFKVTNVTDFAFAVSDHYVWKSSSLKVDASTGRRARVDAVFNPKHHTYLPVTRYIRQTVQQMSYHFPGVPFPYAHMTIFDGLDAMEYPMMVNNMPFEDPKDVVEFTAHEVFHTLFPFYVGTNETKYSFMDEGWATMTEFLFHPLLDPDVELKYDLSSVNDYAGLAEDVAVMTPTAQLYGKARFADKDLKPALALFYLREMLGERKFSEATRHFIRSWAGKHPSPFDFFNSMNAGAGVNLNWFWKAWYFEKAIPDLAISNVQRYGLSYRITVTNVGTAPVPVHLTVLLKSGRKLNITRTAEIWSQNRVKFVVPFKATEEVERISLGNDFDADVNPQNNNWSNLGR
ncbi:M1 family metallopeptidase [Mucilaginibacter sp. JRF]|uniref:M1 family metallopeptidase n=1 Tax=Mucilaginibacter sp. JRF TaxID=2780088 RepID=UPI0018800673|nr:M1 family metallopeptidase [Mucilaginibacter sp. JRF]MBE9583313.1 M1 family metallopeptidase [Mucilaginibacter sp. JRF]